VQTLKRSEPLIRILGPATAIGLLTGIVVGGIGGRLAMRLLFLTSDDSVRGLTSDDGFTIGQFTVDTLNLLLTGALFGVVGAFTYLAVRPFLIGPGWLRSLTCAVASGAVLGAIIVQPDGVDFTALSPVGLAAVLFVAIPALFSAITVPLIEHALRPEGWAHTARLPIVAAPLAVFLFPPLLIVVGLPVALVLGVRWCTRRWTRLHAVLHHTLTLWIARSGWGGAALLGLAALAGDVQALR